MEYSKNPFTPTFGSVPPFLAGREHILRDINRGFINGPGDPNLSTIFTGARGTGKTALLSLLSETALEHDWIAANVSAMPGMLEDIIERTKEAADSYLSQPHARINGVQIGPVGIDWTYAQEAQGNWRTRMNGIFKQLEKHDIGLLITIDEVTVDLEEMLQFASVYQHFVREGKKVALLMAGLPYKVSALLRNDSVSFLRRSQYHQLGRITDVEIANAFRKTVEAGGRSITPEALEDAVKAVDGFPYMMQLVGYRTWDVSENSPQISTSDVQQGSLLARMELRDRILETTYRELSDKDIEFLLAMLPDSGPSRVSEIAKRMGVASNYAKSIQTPPPGGRRYRGTWTWPRRLRHSRVQGILEREGVLARRNCPRKHQRMAISIPLGKDSKHFRLC